MMVRASKIIRKSIQNFLNNYHSYASIAALLVFPVSASILLSQAALNPATSPVLQPVHARIRSSSTPRASPSLQFASLLNLKLAQTACAYLLTLPFTLTFLIAAKATIIQILHRNLSAPPRLNSLLPTTFFSVLSTHLCASLFVLSANATAFSLMFITTNALDVVGLSASHAALLCLSAASAIVYSVILANTLVACNLASVVAGMEDCGGPTAVLKACVLIRGRTATALTLALPANLGMAVVEGLFQYRIVRVYHGGINLSIVWEAVTIAYIYSLLVIFDVVTCCIFYKSCISDDDQLSWDDGYHYRIAAEVVADEGGSPKLKACDMP